MSQNKLWQIESDTDSPPKPPVAPKKWSKKKTIVVVIVGLFIIASILHKYTIDKLTYNYDAVFFGILGGETQAPISSSKLIGKTVTFKGPMIYKAACENCGMLPRQAEINNQLTCPFGAGDMSELRLYKNNDINISNVPGNTKFTVVEAYQHTKYGLNTFDSGPANDRLFVLKDSSGTYSTLLAGDNNLPDSVCSGYSTVPQYLTKLFQYADVTNLTHIGVTFEDWNSRYPYTASTSDSALVKDFTQSLHLTPQSALEYSFSNIRQVNNKLGSKFPALEMDVNADGLAYLFSFSHGLSFSWIMVDINGLNPDYINTLSPSDFSKIGIDNLSSPSYESQLTQMNKDLIMKSAQFSN